MKLLMTFNMTMMILASGCGLLDTRSYMDQMVYQEDPFWIPGQDFDVTPGDTGRAYRTMGEIHERTPASEREGKVAQYERSLEAELVNLENRISDADYNYYMKYRDKLATTSEKIYFLKLASIGEKTSYLRARGIEEDVYTNPEYRMAVYQRDVLLGMRKEDVVSSWGSPDKRDVAGNPALENERWVYRRNGVTKYIIFESGKVQGWTEAP